MPQPMAQTRALAYFFGFFLISYASETDAGASWHTFSEIISFCMPHLLSQACLLAYFLRNFLISYASVAGSGAPPGILFRIFSHFVCLRDRRRRSSWHTFSDFFPFRMPPRPTQAFLLAYFFRNFPISYASPGFIGAHLSILFQKFSHFVCLTWLLRHASWHTFSDILSFSMLQLPAQARPLAYLFRNILAFWRRPGAGQSPAKFFLKSIQ